MFKNIDTKILLILPLLCITFFIKSARADLSDSKDSTTVDTPNYSDVEISLHKNTTKADLKVYEDSSNIQQNDKRKKDFVIEHILDAYEWHFATINEYRISIPLPVIIYRIGHGFDIFLSNKFHNKSTHSDLDKDIHKDIVGSYKGYFLKNGKVTYKDSGTKIYDLSITKNVVAMLISFVLMCVIFILAARKYRYNFNIAPKGFWMFIELIIVFVRDEIAKPNIGLKKYKKFMPFLLTLFFFIWVNNLLGLLPGAANVTGNISITLTLALLTFLVTNISGKKEYWKHVFSTPGVPKWLLPIMVPIEIIGLFTKPFSLMIRLFANITAGHIILLSIINIIFIFKSCWLGFVSVPFGVFMFMLKLLVAFLQAYVFTLMSAIYFGNAVSEVH